jgi:hypothetical protein
MSTYKEKPLINKVPLQHVEKLLGHLKQVMESAAPDHVWCRTPRGY